MLISLLALQQSRNKPASLYKPLTQSLSFHRPRHTIQTHDLPMPTTHIGDDTIQRHGECCQCENVTNTNYQWPIIETGVLEIVCRNPVAQKSSSRWQAIASFRVGPYCGRAGCTPLPVPCILCIQWFNSLRSLRIQVYNCRLCGS